MKKLTLAVSLVMASTIFAAPRTVAAEKKKTTVTTSYSSPSSIRFGLGFTTWGTVPGLVSVAGVGSAASIMMEFNELTSLQPFFAINSTTPFAFGVGAVLRHTLHGGSDDGFHVGLGFDLGTSTAGAAAAAGTSFFVDIFPVGGFHFGLGGHVSNIKISFDMGPVFAITPTFNFSTKPLGVLGGASIHYMF